MNLYLSKLHPENKDEFISFHREFIDAGGKIYPGIINKYNGDFSEFLENIEKAADRNSLPAEFVESDTYILRDVDGRIYGMSSLRHRLTEGLLIGGGHIGYGIRPSERGKGYGTYQLTLLLEKCRELGITKVLITCDRDNNASAKVAIHNGGILEDEITESDGNILQRYWIEL